MAKKLGVLLAIASLFTFVHRRSRARAGRRTGARVGRRDERPVRRHLEARQHRDPERQGRSRSLAGRRDNQNRTGYIIYDPAGYMAVTIMPLGRKKYVGAQPTDEEAQAASPATPATSARSRSTRKSSTSPITCRAA